MLFFICQNVGHQLWHLFEQGSQTFSMNDKKEPITQNDIKKTSDVSSVLP